MPVSGEVEELLRLRPTGAWCASWAMKYTTGELAVPVPATLQPCLHKRCPCGVHACAARMEQTTLRTEWTRLTDGAIFVGARRRELFLCPLEVGLSRMICCHRHDVIISTIPVEPQVDIILSTDSS